MAEHALRPSDARAHGAGLLLAEAALGVSHGLHSRAAALLPLLLQEDPLAPEDLQRKVALLCPCFKITQYPCQDSTSSKRCQAMHAGLSML
jgi:hypothetical protein